MATIGFLLAPLREILASRDEKWMATVQSWIDIANRSWFDQADWSLSDSMKSLRVVSTQVAAFQI